MPPSGSMPAKPGVLRCAVLPVLAGLILCAVGAFFHQRYLAVNFGVVAPGAVYRSAQPSPEDLARFARERGLKSVLNLRDDTPDLILEAETRAAQRLGLSLFSVPLSARTPPTPTQLFQIIHAIRNGPKPMLIHCRAGADRTGVVSVLAAMAIAGKPYQTARKQLSVRHLRLLPANHGIGSLLTAFEHHADQKGLENPSWPDFVEWAASHYADKQ